MKRLFWMTIALATTTLAFLCIAFTSANAGPNAVAQMQPPDNARWICKAPAKDETANAALKDSASTPLVCKEVFITLKTVGGKTLVTGNATSKAGSANKATTVDVTKPSDAEQFFMNELGMGGGGGG